MRSYFFDTICRRKYISDLVLVSQGQFSIGHRSAQPQPNGIKLVPIDLKLSLLLDSRLLRIKSKVITIILL